ncbi:hypothetical protein J2T20_003590 [Paenibacillus wynnii]|nr:hypothetical protein [Paenibacillus wynnii]
MQLSNIHLVKSATYLYSSIKRASTTHHIQQINNSAYQQPSYTAHIWIQLAVIKTLQRVHLSNKSIWEQEVGAGDRSRKLGQEVEQVVFLTPRKVEIYQKNSVPLLGYGVFVYGNVT